jgi:hypothetical protein
MVIIVYDLSFKRDQIKHVYPKNLKFDLEIYTNGNAF